MNQKQNGTNGCVVERSPVGDSVHAAVQAMPGLQTQLAVLQRSFGENAASAARGCPCRGA